MTARVSIVIALFMLPSAATGAQLEPEPRIGTRIPVPPEDFPLDKTREVMRDFAECAVKKRPALAHGMVLDVSTHTVQNRFMPVADPDCLVQATLASYDVTRLEMTRDIFRFAVAEALVKKNLSGFDPLQLRQAAALGTPVIDLTEFMPKPNHRYRKAELEELELGRKKAEGGLALTKYGECVVRAAPAGARRLLDTRINSEDELGALRSLMPAFSGCLDRGAQFRSDRAALRGAIALNYYRLAYAPKVAAAPTKAAQ